jgi:antitoxin component of MazEF toxin-antitoxin module
MEGLRMPLVKRLSRIGTSSGVILDRAVLRQVDLEPDAEVEVSVEGKRIVITAHRYASEPEFADAKRKVFSANRKSLERLAKR